MRPVIIGPPSAPLTLPAASSTIPHMITTRHPLPPLARIVPTIHWAPRTRQHIFAGILAIALTVLLQAGCRTPAPIDDPWFARDKALHFVGSAILAGTAYAALANNPDAIDAPEAPLAFGFALSFGVAKEAYDQNIKRTFWSWRDLAWDVAGAAAGCAIIAADQDRKD